MAGNQALNKLRQPKSLSVTETGEQTLDSFVKMWAERTPDAPAFSDAPNRKEFSVGPPLKLSYSELYHVSGEIAELFTQHGLRNGDVVAIQLPNVAELPVVIIAALRAGLIPCPFPILWRSHELDQALKMVPARALVTIGEFKNFSHSQMMCDLAFDHLSIRFVYGIGSNQSDGVTSLNDYFMPDSTRSGAAETDVETKLDQPALITWSPQTGVSGMRPIYRTHRELISSGLMHVLELGLTTSDRMLNPFPLTGLTGLSAMFAPALLIGASVTQHHPFDYDAYIRQMATEQSTYTIAPAAVLRALVENDIFSHQGNKLGGFGCVWSSPLIRHRRSLLSSPVPIPVYDIHNLNETAVYISKRTDISEQGHIKLGEKKTKGPDGEDVRLLETRFRGRLSSGSGDKKYMGTLYVRGIAVPKGSGIPVKVRNAQNANEGWASTGINCSIAENSDRMDRVVCETDHEIIYHGGYTISRKELDDLYRTFVGFEDAAVVTVADPILGERIWAIAKPVEILKPSIDDLRDFLNEAGVSPCKIPERLITVDHIPRSREGRPDMRAILDLVRKS